MSTIMLTFLFFVNKNKIDKQFQTDINRDNPLGFGGSLAIAFAVILRQLWSGQRDSIEPSHLKNLLANRASQFSGYAQHDAQEFMAFLLDGLHEVVCFFTFHLRGKVVLQLLVSFLGFEPCQVETTHFTCGIERTIRRRCCRRSLESLQDA